ncbi:DUF1090 domain-containing protein [Aquipseudomonas ullengensis]|uniref:DUF1090 domain-containing protein n=1 Tax=Aquipseudomonas ullengensis TaxID=2759166 RepID=A0A7W4LPM5_9GAMM|nr:DUF1090 domain-containing protein [Pseudomonas ullengensis]MBB2496992.1 DUF1090 domain-containing protein [Pseudomonas ullengensis]
MKKLPLCLSLLALTAAPAFAAEPSPACQAKQADIQAQITAATARGNSQEVAGLQRAMQANQANCSDASLAAEREAKIKEAREEVAERESDLREAEQDGDAQKIAKRRAKLEEARSELLEAEQPLAQ